MREEEVDIGSMSRRAARELRAGMESEDPKIAMACALAMLDRTSYPPGTVIQTHQVHCHRCEQTEKRVARTMIVTATILWFLGVLLGWLIWGLG